MNTSENQLKFFADYIEKEIGIIYSETNYFQLEHRLSDIVAQLSLKDIHELWNMARVGINDQLRGLLLDLATNNETSFFRDAALFSSLTQHMIPALLADNPFISHLRIWSAAGSTGQEAYSIVMSLEQAKAAGAKIPSYEVVVTDVSERVLAKAQEGLYSHLDVQRGLPAKLLIEYFEKQGESSWRIKSQLRDKLIFRKVNLLEPFSAKLGEFDIVFCRNVLIYQSVENKTAVVNKILKILGTKRFLILGAAESLLGISNDLDQIQYDKAVVYRKIA